ncbi:MAG: UDP-N-acetylglucosamine 1-carboxyvinyltransferase, partial [Clostridia bacterium]|nr:UDP-N-acetylglucosamine 1-carboxyvinyltransferase [Clostridia bacterium]
ATENVMMASVLLKGKTTIINCAKEPEIVDLANFLNSMGAKVFGAGTDTIEVVGVKNLHSCTYKPIPDRIITGTYLIAGAMTGGEIELENTNAKHIYSLISKLKNNGCKIHTKGDKISLNCDRRLKSIAKIETMPYPGFPTDLQPQAMALLCTSKGCGLIVENLFETRFKHVPYLNKMGANIVIKDRTAFVRGVGALYGAEVEATDLRGGAGLVLAGLVAQGYTTVKNVEYIDRGYEHIEKDLQNLGANIERIT